MEHPNKHPFLGILTFVDKASDKAPSGARGHKVLVTKKAMEHALPTLIGMAVNYQPGWNGHQHKNKIGIIETAKILDTGAVSVSGYLFGKDEPAVIREIQALKEKLGMSYDILDAHVTDICAPVWEITRLTFTGAAILKANKAAYKMTEFVLL